MPHETFPRLFEPLTINGVTLPNRSAISAHFAGWWVSDALPNADFAAYVEERAKGGIGLFVVGATGPTWAAAPDWMQNSDATDGRIQPAYRMLADAAHRHGTKLFAQLIHTPDPLPGPFESRIRLGMKGQALPRSRRRRPPPPDRTAGEIKALVDAYGRAAGRALEGGVDGLELHAHEGFLQAQFLSPAWNSREDEYGGSLENRMRLIVECLQSMRRAAGRGVPLGVRLKAHDQEEQGLSEHDYVEVVRRLEAMDLVDYVSLTGGDGGLHHGPMSRLCGEWLPYVRTIKSSTGLPIMHAGRVTTPEMAEAALADGTVDVVCLTKAHVADPHFTRKARENRVGEIRHCTRCLQECIGNMEHMSCVYNPVTSREREWATLAPAATPRRVVVVGAGPAGMEAAVILAARGHEVIVLEKGGRVGGQVWLGAASPSRKLWARIGEFYARAADAGRAGDVRLDAEATADAVLALKPDAVLVATGSHARVDGRTLDPRDLLAREDDELRAWKSAVVVERDDAYPAMVACDRLSSLGVAVRYVTPGRWPFEHAEGMTREQFMPAFESRGGTVSTLVDLAAWDGRTAVTRHRRTAEEDRLAADAVVLCRRPEPVAGLAGELAGRVGIVRVLGDAAGGRSVYDATLQAGVVAREL